MSSDESANDELHWRETYFIMFPNDRRPELKVVATALTEANRRYRIENPESNDEGQFDSLLVESREDNAAVEISYEVGDAVIEQNLQWAKELKDQLTPDQLQQLIRSDARLDVAHFERMSGQESDDADKTSGLDSGTVEPFMEDEEPFEMLDPTCLLTVVETLCMLTDGLTLDPASGEILT